MRILSRRVKKEAPELEITAFLNLMVALIPFLLVTAVFSQVTIINLNLPPPAAGGQQQSEQLSFEVVIRSNALEVADSKGGLIKRIEKKGDAYDYKTLTEVLKQVKARFPNKTDIMILSEKNTSYDTLVQVMDASRLFETVEAGSLIQAELFPDISIGDAPTRK